MLKELEVLNDYVDGYLSAVLDEENSMMQSGKIQFIQAFRDSLMKVPVDQEKPELIKLLNRNLLKASTVPTTIAINKKRGFEEALKNIQNKLKELFNLDDLTTGTIAQYLQDIPFVAIHDRVEFPDPSELFKQDKPEETLQEFTEKIRDSILAQVKVLKDHCEQNGQLIVISDLGYTTLNNLTSGNDVLEGLIEASKDSIKQLDKMTEKALLMIKMHRSKGGKFGNNNSDED